VVSGIAVDTLEARRKAGEWFADSGLPCYRWRLSLPFHFEVSVVFWELCTDGLSVRGLAYRAPLWRIWCLSKIRAKLRKSVVMTVAYPELCAGSTGGAGA